MMRQVRSRARLRCHLMSLPRETFLTLTGATLALGEECLCDNLGPIMSMDAQAADLDTDDHFEIDSIVIYPRAFGSHDFRILAVSLGLHCPTTRMRSAFLLMATPCVMVMLARGRIRLRPMKM